MFSGVNLFMLKKTAKFWPEGLNSIHEMLSKIYLRLKMIFQNN